MYVYTAYVHVLCSVIGDEEEEEEEEEEETAPNEPEDQPGPQNDTGTSCNYNYIPPYLMLNAYESVHVLYQ